MSGKSTTNAKSAKPAKVTAKTVEQTTVADAGIKPEAPAQLRQPNGPAEVLGDVVWLMSHSPAHKHLFISDMDWLVLPPVMHKQFRLFKNGDKSFAFISWATVSDEVEVRISKGQLRMGPADWRSGEQAWIIDMVAPFGGGEQALKEVRERIFPGRKVKALQPAPDGAGLGVVEW